MRLSLCILALAAAGCGSAGLDPTPSRSTGAGQLRYEARTLDGALLLTGRISIEILADSTIVGEWAVQWAPGADTTVEVGDQIGSGTLAGQQGENGTYIDLNPGYNDNNVILLPIPADRGFTGTWYWSTIAGPRTYGKFTALRE